MRIGQTLRLAPLLARELAVFEMTDSILAMPQWAFHTRIRTLLWNGGTQRVGPLELGAWWSAYTRNQTEGNRFRLDLRTSKAFSTRVMPRVFAAYGTYGPSMERWF